MNDVEENFDVNEILISPDDVNDFRNKYMSEKKLKNGNRQVIVYLNKNYDVTDKENARYARIEEYNSDNYLIRCDVEDLLIDD